MEIINLDINKNKYENVAVALGNFDGIHLGHQELIKKVVNESKKNNLKPSILFFENHTKSIINNKNPKMLTNNNQKYKLAKSLGIEVIYTLDFTKKIMNLSQEKFIEIILKNKLNTKLVVVGFDYRFGFKAKGTSNSLLDLNKKYNIKTEIIKPVEINGEVISSSYIRNLIKDGNLNSANKLLGRNYSIQGKVVSGASRGTGLGFPTANLEYDENYLLPLLGVYKTNTKIDDKLYLSMTDIGYNPTFNEDRIKLETYILNFSKDIYGKTMEIEFLDFLRKDIKFKNKEELINQLEKDKNRVLNS